MNSIQKYIRHAKLISGRLCSTLRYPNTSPNIMFIHLPKCAGTSLSNSLYASIPFRKRIGVIDADATRLAAGLLYKGTSDKLICHEDLTDPAMCFKLREAQMIMHMYWKTNLIHGHVLWSEKVYETFKLEYQFVTMMREPIARAISNFKMNLANKIIPPMSIDDFLNTSLGFHHSSCYLRYFSGEAKISEKNADNLLQLAMTNARKFSLIGNVENHSDFIQNYKKKFGIKLGIRNYNISKISDIELNDKQLTRLKTLCRYDQEIYDNFLNWQGEIA